MSQYQQPPQPFGPQPTPPYAPGGMPPYAPPPMSGLALASLICSAIFCCPVVALLGTILGLAALPGTGSGQRRGRGLAIGGILIGLLVTAGWVVGTYFVVRVTAQALDKLKEPINRFVDDYNRGDDQAIYDRMVGKTSGLEHPEFHAKLEEVRKRYGKAERIESVWSLLTSGGSQMKIVNDQATADFPLKFDKGGSQRVFMRLHFDGQEWKLVALRIGEVKVVGDVTSRPME